MTNNKETKEERQKYWKIKKEKNMEKDVLLSKRTRKRRAKRKKEAKKWKDRMIEKMNTKQTNKIEK